MFLFLMTPQYMPYQYMQNNIILPKYVFGINILSFRRRARADSESRSGEASLSGGGDG